MMNKLLRQYITFENIIIGFGIQPDCVKGMFEMLKNDTECVELDMNGMENKLSSCCIFNKGFNRKCYGSSRDKANK